MTIQTVLIVLIIGLAAGMLSGLVGVGGGIIIVPALVLCLGFFFNILINLFYLSYRLVMVLDYLTRMKISSTKILEIAWTTRINLK